MQHPENLVWIDLEMTGLSPENDRIIEIASIVTDRELNILAEGPVLAISQPLSRLTQMDEWNTRTHTESGLVRRVKESDISESEADSQTLSFIEKYVGANQSPLCGNSICQDRRFIVRYLPRLEAYLHYRHIDVSTIKELVKRWNPDILYSYSKKNTHRALDDIYESVEELRFYRRYVFSPDLRSELS